jgi:hypothetical protein
MCPTSGTSEFLAGINKNISLDLKIYKAHASDVPWKLLSLQQEDIIKRLFAAMLGLALVGSTIVAISFIVDPAEAAVCFRRGGFYC